MELLLFKMESTKPAWHKVYLKCYFRSLCVRVLMGTMQQDVTVNSKDLGFNDHRDSSRRPNCLWKTRRGTLT